jgi:hypothetical protein
MAIEESLTGQQKENLEMARRILRLRSRADVFRWFADNAVRIAGNEPESPLTGIGYIEQGNPPASPKKQKG